MNFESIEKALKERAKNNLTSPYAFYVFITEEEYQFLLKQSNSLINGYNLPWCQIKLLTEIYNRAAIDKGDFRGPRILLSEELKLDIDGGDFKYIWENILNIFKNCGLKTISEEDKKKYEKINYKNFIIHAGVPGSYFDELYNKTKNSYEEHGAIESITIDDLADILIYTEDIFDFNSSSYFKKVFEETTEKKALFSWFLELIKIEKQIEKHNLDITKLNLESKEIPSSFFNHLKIPRFKLTDKSLNSLNKEGFEEKIINLLKALLDKPLPERELRSKLKNLKFSELQIELVLKHSKIEFISEPRNRNISQRIIFDYDEGTVKYIVKLPKPVKDFSKIKFICDEKNDPEWDEVIKNSEELSEISFKILPKHLDKNILFSFDDKLIDKFKLNSNILLFNDQYKLLRPDGSYTIKKQLTILSNNEQELKNSGIKDDLCDAWYQWKHYEVNKGSSKISKGILHEPYQNTEIEFTNDITGDWQPGKNLLCKREGKMVFGGDELPEFIFSHERDISKYNVIANFQNQETTLKNYGSLEKISYDYLWKNSELKFDHSKYEISLKLVDNKMNIIEGFQECIWYPGLRLEITPEKLLWDNEPCQVKLIYKDELNFRKSIPEIDVKPKQQENYLSWEFPQKPSFSTPHMLFKYGNDFIDINFRLPYLSVWVYSEKLNENLFWDTEKPIRKEVLEKIYNQDSNARIWFYYHGRNKEIISIKEKKEEETETKKFDFFREFPKRSVRYGDYIGCSKVWISYPEKKKVVLFQDEMSGLKSGKNFWSFEKINQIMKEEILNKNI